MRGLGAAGAAVHEVAHELRRDGRGVAGDLVGELEGAGERGVGRGQDLGEEGCQERVGGGVDGARRGQVQGAREADETRQEVRRARFHDDAAAREDEADLCGAARKPDGGGEGHGDADADRRAVDRGDGRLAAVVDRERDAAAARREEERGLVWSYLWGRGEGGGGEVTNPSRWSPSRAVSFCELKPMSRSAPAQNILPFPVRTTQRTRSSTSTMVKTRTSSSSMTLVKAL